MSLAGGQPTWLIVQLARFGDLMQTAPVTREIGLRFPEVELHILVDEPHRALAALLPNVSKVHTLSRSEGLRLAVQGDLAKSLDFWKQTLAGWQEYRFDQVINLTHTPESAVIASLLETPHRSGLVRDRHGNYSADHWDRLFRSILPRRDWGGLHLIEYHLGIAGVFPATPPETPRHRNRPEPVVGIQLGANSPLRIWPAEKFAALSDILIDQAAAKVVTYGSESERRLADRFLRSAQHPVIDRVGTTALSGGNSLSDSVADCDLLIGGDTGTLHLAASLGVPCIGIFLGMARPDDTAPWQNGAVVFEPVIGCYPCPESSRCSEPVCNNRIPAERIARAALDVLANRPAEPDAGEGWEKRVVRFDSNGLFYLEGKTRRPRSQRELMRALWESETGVESVERILDEGLASPETEAMARLAEKGLHLTEQIEKTKQSGLQRRNLVRELQKIVETVESYRLRDDFSGLVGSMFSLELERPPAEPSAALELVKEGLRAVVRRARFLNRSSISCTMAAA